MKSLPQLFSGFGDSVAQAIEQALTLGVSLGSSVAEIAQSVTQALMQPLYRALTIAGDWLVSGFRDAQKGVIAGAEGMSGWVWDCDLTGDPCPACLAMQGTIHAADEDMETHFKCHCQQSYFSGSPPEDVISGDDWLDMQPDDVQEDLLGKSAFRAYKAGAISLQDFVGYEHSEEYGTSMYRKSLKEILGEKKAKQYYG